MPVAASMQSKMDFFAGARDRNEGGIRFPWDQVQSTFSYVRPLGVVAKNHFHLIIPFMFFLRGKIAAPLAAGNSVVVKPPRAGASFLRRGSGVDLWLAAAGWLHIATGVAEAGVALAAQS